MRKILETNDSEGHVLKKGDIVAPIRDYVRARICDIAADSDSAFVQLRPLHQPYSRAVWHAAEHVIWLASKR